MNNAKSLIWPGQLRTGQVLTGQDRSGKVEKLRSVKDRSDGEGSSKAESFQFGQVRLS